MTDRSRARPTKGKTNDWRPPRRRAEVLKAVAAVAVVLFVTVAAIFLLKPDDPVKPQILVPISTTSPGTPSAGTAGDSTTIPADGNGSTTAAATTAATATSPLPGATTAAAATSK